MIQQILLIIHIFLAFSIIALVLLQHGKGADAGAAFGSGASGTLFGSKGSTSFLTRATTMLALFFAITSLGLGYLSAHQNRKSVITVEQHESWPEQNPELPY